MVYWVNDFIKKGQLITNFKATHEQWKLWKLGNSIGMTGVSEFHWKLVETMETAALLGLRLVAQVFP